MTFGTSCVASSGRLLKGFGGPTKSKSIGTRLEGRRWADIDNSSDDAEYEVDDSLNSFGYDCDDDDYTSNVATNSNVVVTKEECENRRYISSSRTSSNREHDQQSADKSLMQSNEHATIVTLNVELHMRRYIHDIHVHVRCRIVGSITKVTSVLILQKGKASVHTFAHCVYTTLTW